MAFTLAFVFVVWSMAMNNSVNRFINHPPSTPTLLPANALHLLAGPFPRVASVQTLLHSRGLRIRAQRPYRLPPCLAGSNRHGPKAYTHGLRPGAGAHREVASSRCTMQCDRVIAFSAKVNRGQMAAQQRQPLLSWRGRSRG